MLDTGLNLDEISKLLVWTAVAIYTLAFGAYAIDLARRSDLAVKAKDAVPARVPVAAGGVGAIDEVRAAERVAQAELEAPLGSRARYVWARIGTSLTILGFLFHVGGDVLRGIAAERVPWSNMYEFALTGTMLIVAVYLGVLLRYDLRFLGSFVTGLTVVLLGGATLAYYVEVVPLADPLKSIWLVIHVFVASLATAFLALAFALVGAPADAGAARAHRDPGDGCRRRREAAPHRAQVPAHPSGRRCAGVARVPVHDHRLHLLDLHPDRRLDLGQRRVGPLLGVRHQGSVDLRHLGALRRLHPRPARRAAGAAPVRRGWRSSASRRCCSTSRSSTSSSRASTSTAA